MSDIHRPYLVKKRIFENRSLWGVIAEVNGELQKIDARTMLTMLNNDVPFLVDYPGADRPSSLTVAHRLNSDGMTFYFRAIGDSTKKNNFNKVTRINIKDVDAIPTINYSG